MSVVVRKVHKSHNLKARGEKDMYTKEFGEVEVVSGEYRKGFIIRQTGGGIVLEEHFDTENSNVDVIHRFDDGMTLLKKSDFCECLAKAREYVPDLNVPLHVMKLYPPDLNSDK